MRLTVRISLLVFALSMGCAVVPAAITFEQPGGTGFLPGTAQAISASTTEILGELLSPVGGFPANTVDMYRFAVPAAFFFTARTVGLLGDVPDPQLFLFGGSGTGSLWNNDRSLSPSDTQAELPLQQYTAGTYYLAVSWFAVDPVDALGQYLFDTLGSNGGGPAGPGGANPIAGWLDTGAPPVWDDMVYEIALDVTIPEPSTSGLALLGGLILVAVRRRRHSNINR